MSITQLILHASLPVQLILLLLLIISLISWYWIFRKGLQIHHSRLDTREFEDRFWRQPNLKKMYEELSQRKDTGALERIYITGFSEYLKIYLKMPRDSVMNGVQLAMRASFQREIDALDDHLSFLASTGSVSPYIGLFGTVWGIMQSFHGLSNVHQATLAQVAPGIAEALIATALGLFAAIPAVLAYNHYAQEIDRLRTHFDSFMAEFSSLLHRELA